MNKIKQIYEHEAMIKLKAAVYPIISLLGEQTTLHLLEILEDEIRDEMWRTNDSQHS